MIIAAILELLIEIKQEMESFQMPDGKQSQERTLHLENPWTQLLYRQYQAKLKYSPPQIALNEEEIIDASRTLEYLHSEKTKAYLDAYPEKKEDIDRRKKKAITCINQNKAIIANHHTSMRSMRERLIRYGFLDEYGNSLYKPSQEL